MKYALFLLAFIGSSLAFSALDFPTFEIDESDFDIPEFPEVPEFPAFQEEEQIDDELPTELATSYTDHLVDLANSTEENRIIGGAVTTIERIPWQISLRQQNNHICGGSIISATRGLTAARCVNPNFPLNVYTIMAGSTTRTGDDNTVIRRIQRLVNHPQFDPRNLQFDVSVIWFAAPLPLGPRIQPVPIAAQDAPAQHGTISLVSGWGITRYGIASSVATTLKYVTIPLVSNQQCNAAYKGRITDDMLCAGLPGGGRDACQGDTGGALIANRQQVGIVSWGLSCGRPNLPGVYARVAAVSNWIRSVV